MSEKRYLLGTGYTGRSKTPIPPQDFMVTWLRNVVANARPQPAKILIVTDDSPLSLPMAASEWITVLRCPGNLGHVRDKDEGRTSFMFTGWAGAMMTAAMVAYNSVLDFVFQEQDCLAFGPYIEKLYEDMGEGWMTIGCPPGAPHHQLPSSQSLFIVRHHYIPIFIQKYIASGEDISKPGRYAENRFYDLHKENPNWVRVTGSWNMDRARPIDWYAPVLAVQQWTYQELLEAKSRNLI